MLNFLDLTINNVYLRAFIYLAIVFVALKLTIFIIEKVILKFTVKTKTNLDDIILKKTSRPLTLIVLLAGLRIALLEFPFSQKTIDLVSNIFVSILIILIVYLIYSLFNVLFERAWKKAVKKAGGKPNEGIIGLIEGTINVFLIIGTFLYLLSYWGFEIGPFLTGLGIGGIAIAFALQASLANVIGGISIILDKTIRVDDWIKLEDGTVGIIQKIGLRSTKLKTFDNEIIFVPNSTLSNSKVQNIALPAPKARTVIPFGVAYGSDIEKVKKIVLKEIKKVNHFINDPEPTVKFLEMGPSSLNFKAYFYVDTFENRFGAIDEANTKIYNALNKAGIKIPFPQMDVHMKK